MSGKAVAKMRELLCLAGYRLTGDTPADWEINACGAGFDLAEEAVEKLLGDLFAATAWEERLTQWEKKVWGQSLSGGLEDRRAVLKARLGRNPGGFTPEDFAACLLGAGVKGALQETENGITVLLGRLLGVTKEQASAALDGLFPAHLEWVWDEGVHWTALDAWAPDFNTLDSLGRSWEEIETMTRTDLEQACLEQTSQKGA